MNTTEPVQKPIPPSNELPHNSNHHENNQHGENEPELPRRSWAILILALVAQILVVLDISVVNTALPTIGADLQLSSGELQWLVTALMTPAALAILMTTYVGAQRTKGLALWGAVGGLGIAAGVLVGGVITTWAGWQMIFWINVPIGIGAIIAARMLLPGNIQARKGLGQLDLPGALTAVTGLAALVSAFRPRPATAGHHPKHLAHWLSPGRCWPPSGSSSGGCGSRWCRRTPGASGHWSPRPG